MTCDNLGRPICPNCMRPITNARRADHGRAYVFTCEHCGIEETVAVNKLRQRASQPSAG